MSQIRSTYKSGETEEVLDVVFYRPVGYVFALAGRGLRVSPNAMTFTGALVGIAGGHLLYYADAAVNLAGILLIVISEALDSADGQLARMTKNISRSGRILDGIGDNLKFISIYIHLTLRMIGSSGQWWLFGMTAFSGLCHSTQSAIADYYRTCFIHFAIDPDKGDIERLDVIVSRYRALSWSDAFFEKLVVRLYLNYSKQQRPFIGTYTTLFALAAARFGVNIPPWFRYLYRKQNEHLTKYYNILTTNTRMVVLFAAVLSREFWMYFAFELTVLNALLAYVVWKQRAIARILIDRLAHEPQGGHR